MTLKGSTEGVLDALLAALDWEVEEDGEHVKAAREILDRALDAAREEGAEAERDSRADDTHYQRSVIGRTR